MAWYVLILKYCIYILIALYYILIKYFILEHVWCPTEEVCLVDRSTTNTILREIKYFQSISKNAVSLTTIAGSDACIIGSGRATIILPMGTTLVIEEALLYPESTTTLLSFKDIRANGFRVETEEEYGKKYLLITKREENGKRVLEKLPSLETGLYYTNIKALAAYTVLKDSI